MLNASELLAGINAIRDSVQLVDRLLRAGALLRASDIHLDPSAEAVRVRFRIDGQLEEVAQVSSTLQSALTSRLKVLASLDIAERRAPQDGGFTWRMTGAGAFGATPVDVRMATLPVRHGERVTLRLLETGARRLGLTDLGLAPADLAVFNRVLRRPHGLVLLTGPTGSGKTTTLYAALTELLKGEALNIITVEDPIEYEIPGVAQVEVDAADKVNFSKALKSLLRHDPDVVMIGEIRDRDSLDAAVKAALTGHLVLSTLHANDAKSTVPRLIDLGLDASLVPAVLRLAVSQRLVRCLCAACKVRGVTGLEARGCVACGGRGYVGRTGLFELYSPEMGVETALAADAAAKVAAGVTSQAEILKVVGD